MIDRRVDKKGSNRNKHPELCEWFQTFSRYNMDHREMSSRNRVQAQTTYRPVPLISSIISVEKYMVSGHDSTGRTVRL